MWSIRPPVAPSTAISSLPMAWAFMSASSVSVSSFSGWCTSQMMCSMARKRSKTSGFTVSKSPTTMSGPSPKAMARSNPASTAITLSNVSLFKKDPAKSRSMVPPVITRHRLISHIP